MGPGFVTVDKSSKLSGPISLPVKKKELDHIIPEVSSSPSVVEFLPVNLDTLFNPLSLWG